MLETTTSKGRVEKEELAKENKQQPKRQEGNPETIIIIETKKRKCLKKGP